MSSANTNIKTVNSSIFYEIKNVSRIGFAKGSRYISNKIETLELVKFTMILVFTLSVCNHTAFSQEIATPIVAKDTLKAKEIDPLRPSKAAFYSAILPGLGQAYNKKYWKIPIVYGAIGTSLYFYIDNGKKYHSYRDAYKRRLLGFNDDQYQYLDDSRLIQAQRFYQRNRDLSLLISVGFYILNIVDANVDAHLIQFNVSDKLTFQPEVYTNDINYKPNLGLTFNYKF